jgi:hypothetical protein
VREAAKARAGEISQAAVARVIADYLKIEGTLRDDDDREYRKLKDRVHRALSGRALTPDTLTWFTCAFILTQDDARQLWARFTGATPEQVDDRFIERLCIPPKHAAAFSAAGFETVSLTETHRVGPDGRPAGHRTEQRIRATDEWLWRFPVRFRDRISEFNVVAGSGRKSEIYRCGEGLYAVDIILAEPLRRGEEATVEYVLTYDPSTPDERRFQRRAAQNMRDVEISVKFDPQRLPDAVWWANWREFGTAATPFVQEPISLDPKNPVVRKKLTSAEQTTVGFCWRWPEE